MLLAPKDGAATVLPSDSIAVAAAWGVARMGDRKADALLDKLLGSSSPDVRALAAIGLGLTHDRKHAAPALAGARWRARPRPAPPRGPPPCTRSPSWGGDADPALLLANAGASDVLLRQAALLAMARLGARDDAGRDAGAAARTTGPADALATALFSPDEALRATAALAGAALATHSYRRSREALPVPDGPLTLRDVLAGLAPDAYGPADRAATLVALGPALRKAAVAAVSTSPDRARVVADALLDGGKKLGLAPFTAPGEKLDDRLSAAVDEVVESIAQAVVPGFVALVRHPAVEVRTRAVELLAIRPEPDAQAAVIDALGDPDESVRRAALAAVGPGARRPPRRRGGRARPRARRAGPCGCAPPRPWAGSAAVGPRVAPPPSWWTRSPPPRAATPSPWCARRRPAPSPPSTAPRPDPSSRSWPPRTPSPAYARPPPRCSRRSR